MAEFDKIIFMAWISFSLLNKLLYSLENLQGFVRNIYPIPKHLCCKKRQGQESASY